MANKARLIPRKMLSSDERVILETRPSAWLYMKGAAVAVIIALVALVALLWKQIPDAPEIPYFSEALEGEYGEYIEWALLGTFVLMMLVFAVRRLRWSATIYAATDERIITQRGIINKTYEDVPVTMISSVDLAQSIGKRALGYGTIVFSTQGQSGARKKGLVWEAVPDPFAVRRRLQEVMDVRSKPKE
jgi:membrane protein YdbS with pleckstrin-like domain